jgi:hypothetical protein
MWLIVSLLGPREGQGAGDGVLDGEEHMNWVLARVGVVALSMGCNTLKIL